MEAEKSQGQLQISEEGLKSFLFDTEDKLQKFDPLKSRYVVGHFSCMIQTGKVFRTNHLCTVVKSIDNYLLVYKTERLFNMKEERMSYKVFLAKEVSRLTYN